MNVIDAIINLVNNPITKITKHYHNKNRANNSGDALEEYIKDLFANTFNVDETTRTKNLSLVFSYLGNNSNPPDAMLKDGDAIEIKKIETDSSGLQLNSSYPKKTLRSSSTLISDACRKAEKWTEKDMLYVVGVIKENELKSLCMVYGNDYCASDEVYSGLRSKIKDGIQQIGTVNFEQTKELGHINHVDPLGITFMRVRGMWGIDNPWKAFRYVYVRPSQRKFTFMCIINEEKWNSFPNKQSLILLEQSAFGLSIKDVEVKNPDNPAQLKKAKLITYEII